MNIFLLQDNASWFFFVLVLFISMKFIRLIQNKCEILYVWTQLCCLFADAFSGSSPSWKPELAIVQYSPKPLNYGPESESHAEGNWTVLKLGKEALIKEIVFK